MKKEQKFEKSESRPGYIAGKMDGLNAALENDAFMKLMQKHMDAGSTFEEAFEDLNSPKGRLGLKMGLPENICRLTKPKGSRAYQKFLDTLTPDELDYYLREVEGTDVFKDSLKKGTANAMRDAKDRVKKSTASSHKKRTAMRKLDKFSADDLPDSE